VAYLLIWWSFSTKLNIRCKKLATQLWQANISCHFISVRCQRSFYKRLTNEKQAETFFKVFFDRMQDAQQSIKASMSANADESLASTEHVESKDDVNLETKRKGGFCCALLNSHPVF